MEKNLLNSILSDDNLNEAYKRVHKNKGPSEVDNMMTSDFKQHLKEHGQEPKD